MDDPNYLKAFMVHEGEGFKPSPPVHCEDCGVEIRNPGGGGEAHCVEDDTWLCEACVARDEADGLLVDKLTFSGLVHRYNIRMSATRTLSNPFMDDNDRAMAHWKCTLRHERRRMTLVFSMGSGFGSREPKVDEVLACLRLDSDSLESAGYNFETWANDLGFDPDSRKHERNFTALCRQQKALAKLLSPAAWCDFLKCEEDE